MNHSPHVSSGNANAAFGLAPAAPIPSVNPKVINAIRQNTQFGAIKAIVGSRHAFVKKSKVKRQVPGVVKKDGKPNEIEFDHEELYHREVMNLAPYAHELSALGMLRWIELGGDLSADTEEELLAKIHAKYGSNVQMKKAGRIVLYCAESKCEVNVPRVVNSQDANGNWFAESKLVAEIALLSDREPNADQVA